MLPSTFLNKDFYAKGLSAMKSASSGGSLTVSMNMMWRKTLGLHCSVVEYGDWKGMKLEVHVGEKSIFDSNCISAICKW